MGLKEIAVKVKKVLGGNTIGKGMAPEEVELASYKKREYLDGVKRQVHRYRIEDSKRMFTGNTFERSKRTVLNPSGKKRKKRPRKSLVKRLRRLYPTAKVERGKPEWIHHRPPIDVIGKKSSGNFGFK
ncbi:MAG: hypothetical protein ABIH63_04395 [archaeon]